jgi:hypothetical protein
MGSKGCGRLISVQKITAPPFIHLALPYFGVFIVLLASATGPAACQESGATVPGLRENIAQESKAQEKSVFPDGNLSARVIPFAQASSFEETNLSRAWSEVKRNDLSAALKTLGKLKAEYPENADYLLLYRLAARRQDSQEWYRFQRWVQNKEERKQPAKSYESEKLSTRSSSPRVNELKEATWLLLATGHSARK